MSLVRRSMSGDKARASGEASGALRVVVASQHALVAESVRAALTERAFDPVVFRWPATSEAEQPWGKRSPRARRVVASRPDVGMLLTDADVADQVLPTQVVLEAMRIPWLVLSAAVRGPVWGAYYASGAALVVPTSTSLESVCGLLADVAADRRSPGGPRGRRELIQSWRSFAEERAELTERLASLTVRERQVLRQLYDGVGVRHIAEESEVAEATVRSQVKAILRKLDVSSQIAAVAAYEELLADSTASPASSWSSSLSAR